MSLFGGKPIGFVDLSRLRFGIFKGYYRQPHNNLLTVKYLAPNSWSVDMITDILPESLIKVESYGGEADKYSHYMVLMAGENGDAPFVDNYLGDNGIVATLIKSRQEIMDQAAIGKAALTAKQRELLRGEKSVLKGVTQDLKMVEEATRREVPDQYGRRRRTQS